MPSGGYCVESDLAGRLLKEHTSIALETLGCKLNQAETEKIAADLSAEGCRMVAAYQSADLIILNTCTVTHVADRKSRYFIRKAHRLNPGAHIVVIGCYAERAAAEISAIEGVALVIGNDEKANLVEILRSAGYLNIAETGSGYSLHNRTRSFIKAQDGCNNFCSYCIVPLVRGREKSLPPEQVIAEVRKREFSGFQEIVITGTEIGRYNSEGLDLCGLLKRILDETSVSRIRLSSLQPEEISVDLVDLWRNPRLCPHFHVSLQSGSLGVLKRMKRRYDTCEYKEIVCMLRERIHDVAVTTDVIVGFPGETEDEFEGSYDFCREMQFSRLHIFPYSVRQGTEAAYFPGKISPPVIKERSQKMLKLANISLQRFNRSFIDRDLKVLFEQTSGACFSGLSGNYIRIYASSRAKLTNKIVPVKIIEVYRDGLMGTVSN
jgi:threonylcarbamoyladenosine tRNA methylthiotransferase MtaB